MREQTTQYRLPVEGVDYQLLTGVNDANLQELARLSGCRVVLRGENLVLSGEAEAVERAVPVARRIIELARLGTPFGPEEVRLGFAGIGSNGRPIAGEAGIGGEPATDRLGGGRGGHLAARATENRIYLPGSKKVIAPASEGQARYLNAIRENDIVIAIGPAGTGKTYLAVATAIDALRKSQVKRIILARPAVEAGENLGFLPGDLQEKVDPYLRPLYDALEDMMPVDWVRRALETRAIEIAPLAYMRGRTLSDAFVILDEAQNATTSQMKMFLTRLGLNSRAVITGDKTQIDLPHREDSGLIEIEEVLSGIEGISFVYLKGGDVVRHRLVKDIIAAYNAAQARREEH